MADEECEDIAEHACALHAVLERGMDAATAFKETAFEALRVRGYRTADDSIKKILLKHLTPDSTDEEQILAGLLTRIMLKDDDGEQDDDWEEDTGFQLIKAKTTEFDRILFEHRHKLPRCIAQACLLEVQKAIGYVVGGGLKDAQLVREAETLIRVQIQVLSKTVELIDKPWWKKIIVYAPLSLTAIHPIYKAFPDDGMTIFRTIRFFLTKYLGFPEPQLLTSLIESTDMFSLLVAQIAELRRVMKMEYDKSITCFASHVAHVSQSKFVKKSMKSLMERAYKNAEDVRRMLPDQIQVSEKAMLTISEAKTEMSKLVEMVSSTTEHVNEESGYFISFLRHVKNTAYNVIVGPSCKIGSEYIEKLSGEIDATYEKIEQGGSIIYDTNLTSSVICSLYIFFIIMMLSFALSIYNSYTRNRKFTQLERRISRSSNNFPSTSPRVSENRSGCRRFKKIQETLSEMSLNTPSYNTRQSYIPKTPSYNTQQPHIPPDTSLSDTPFKITLSPPQGETFHASASQLQTPQPPNRASRSRASKPKTPKSPPRRPTKRSRDNPSSGCDNDQNSKRIRTNPPPPPTSNKRKLEK